MKFFCIYSFVGMSTHGVIYELYDAGVSLAAGTSPKFVQELLGHSTATVTLHNYFHLLPSVADEAIRKLNHTFQDVEKDGVDS